MWSLGLKGLTIETKDDKKTQKHFFYIKSQKNV